MSSASFFSLDDQVYCNGLVQAINKSEFIRKLNINVSCLFIVIGILGNCLGVFVFIQKRFRTHSSSIYLLFICLIDGLFLLIHFFEDTLRTYIDVYLNNESYPSDSRCQSIYGRSGFVTEKTQNVKYGDFFLFLNSFLRSINITDRFDFTCRLVNFLRYYLRFLSAYFIVAFTIQRTLALRFSLNRIKFESNRLVWTIVCLLGLVGFVLNLWVPFTFSKREIKEENAIYCDIEPKFSFLYFNVTIAYIALIMLIPILVIFLCNSLIVFYILKASKKREKMSNMKIIDRSRSRYATRLSTNLNSTETCRVALLSNQQNKLNKSPFLIIASFKKINNNKNKHQNSEPTTHESASAISAPCLYRFSNGSRPWSSSEITGVYALKIKKNNSAASDPNKITRMLLFMSFSYALLNLPYFISWCLFFYRIGIKKADDKIERYNLHSSIQFCELFYVLNYSIHFFIYCASGRTFRALLKTALRIKKS